MNKIYIAGHNGMVGSSLLRNLSTDQNNQIYTKSKDDLNLLDQSEVRAFFQSNNFDQVYLAAAVVGGIHANDAYPAKFIYENLMIQANIIHSAYITGVKKLLFLGSSCIYPKMTEQPIFEDALLTGKLEKTNEPYAIAKIAGLKLCESYNRQYGVDYRSVMPSNLYGPNDNFHKENSHVIPALIRRFHEAKVNKKDLVKVWGSGKPLREFMHVDDLAKASIFIMNLSHKEYWRTVDDLCSHINVGAGKDISIEELAYLIKNIVGYEGEIKFDSNQPDGTPRKLMSVDKLKSLGWSCSWELEDGINNAYEWFLKNIENVRMG